jgi:hypothetical protein
MHVTFTVRFMLVEREAGRMVMTRLVFVIDVFIQIDLLFASVALEPRTVGTTPSVIYRETVYELAEPKRG